MRNFQNTFETRNRSFISAFLICMTIPLIPEVHSQTSFKGTVMQIEKALTNDRLRFSKVS